MAHLVDQLDVLNPLQEPDRAFLKQHCQRMTLPAGKTVFAPDMEAAHFILLANGSVKVSQTGQSGREIILYRIEGGDSCILTTSCLLSGEHYNAEAVTETEVTALLLPASSFNELIAKSVAFRQMVFANYATRIASLIHLVEEVTFEKIDSRLAHKLLILADPEETLDATHQILATELGSAREVISRHLKEFDRNGWIEVSRGQIKLLDKEALRLLAGE
ncbi:MAG: Crp/Fnr family transcriptional regulator [Sneathiellales bacterium]|nr:Crp/Fnr family transcriptional regulator [Sneathiellales bacterium]